MPESSRENPAPDNPHFKYMLEAVELAETCQPAEEKIPRVGAVIVSDEGQIIGRGKRGKNCTDDDEHAELRALKDVHERDRPKLEGSTLYTTLEPCTPDSRSRGEKCCSELIFQHRFPRVFVGIPDPNPDVTRKGLLRLLNANVKVALFPDNLVRRIQAHNGNFIAAQQTWGAKIISPQSGAYLKTYETGGRYAVQFECITPPTGDDYLFISRGGQYYPMAGPFRPVNLRTWEIDAFFGATGHHTLNLVRSNSLGKVLIKYYRKIVEQHSRQRKDLSGQIDLALLGAWYPPIEMDGLQKGLRLEHSVPVFVGPKIELKSTKIEPVDVQRGKAFKITYSIDSAQDVPKGAWLGASFNDRETKKFFNDGPEDRRIPLVKGINTCFRNFATPNEASLGDQAFRTSVWMDHIQGEKAAMVASVPPVPFKIIA
jgi:pyrimidine deaminase RibD-like protein